MPTEPLADATEPGPPNSYPSTPGEFAARWNAWSEERRAEWLAASVANAETAMICRALHPRSALWLSALCRAHGLADEDSAGAILTYTARGRLTAHDRARLADMSEDERSTALAARYGSDAARVAQIDYSQANS